jgi:hypothetical protein
MKELGPSLPPKTIPHITHGSHRERADAIRGGPACGSNFDYAAPLTELVLLGVVAVRAQTRIEWEAVTAKVTNSTDINRFVGPRLRLSSWVGCLSLNRQPSPPNFAHGLLIKTIRDDTDSPHS